MNEKGCQFRHSCPNTHNQNGLVERNYRHNIELCLTLLGLPSLHAFEVILTRHFHARIFVEATKTTEDWEREETKSCPRENASYCNEIYINEDRKIKQQRSI